MPASKVIVTNKKALAAKYGGEHQVPIADAVGKLIAADAEKGFETRRVCLDDAADMDPLGAPTVRRLLDPRQNKDAVDAVYRALEPDYLVILGAPDVVPHQPLANPVPDGDPHVDSDLPYACDAAFSLRPEDFKGPTRVVGRLPDLPGRQRDPAYFVGLLETAAGWVRRRRDAYLNYFGISAEVWQQATRASVASLFGSTEKLHVSPPDGPEWLKAALAARAHLINAHGVLETPTFFGQREGYYPPAHSAAYLDGRVREGTVVAAECCYGAELFDPAASGRQPGIGSAYLGQGAYGFFGSTTIAYGLDQGAGEADLICRYFLREVLGGASLGRAALQARQSYVTRSAPLDPIDLKTLAQFHLLGDPAIHPTRPPDDDSRRSRLALAPRPERRRRLRLRGDALEERTAAVASEADGRLASDLREELRRIAGDHELDFLAEIKSFRVHRPASELRPLSLDAPPDSDGSYYLMLSKLPRGGRDDSFPASVLRRRRSILVATEKDGEITAVRTVHPR